MKAKFTLATALLLASTWIACGGPAHNPTVPKFLVAVDDNSGAAPNVNVFPINATTGALGTAVTGSPFNLGINNAMTVVVHPNGHFVYASDASDGSIHQWDVNESTGVPADIAAKVMNSSGTFFQPNGVTDSDSRNLVITPNGKYLYSANGDASVGAYSVGSNGALTHIADVTISGCASGDPDAAGAITATDNFVWITDTCASEADWHVNTLKIGSNGSLTQSSSVTLTGVDSFLWSIQVNPAANFLYVGDEGGNAQIWGFKVSSTDGSLTQLTLGGSSPQFQDDVDGNGTSSDCRVIDHSPDGKFFYWTDDDDYVHTFSVNMTTGALAELAAPASPFAIQSGGTNTYIGGEGQVVVDVTGTFLYVAQNTSSSGVLAFTRDATTGALTQVGTTPTATAAGIPQAIGIVR
jgi:6-phosphogluconolactonase